MNPRDALVSQIDALLALAERDALTPRVPHAPLELLSRARNALTAAGHCIVGPADMEAVENVWVVGGMVGEYSDRREWTVGVWRSEAGAKAFVEKMDALGRVFELAEIKRWEDDGDTAVELAGNDCKALDPSWSSYCGDAPIYTCWPEKLIGDVVLQVPEQPANETGKPENVFRKGETSFRENENIGGGSRMAELEQTLRVIVKGLRGHHATRYEMADLADAALQNAAARHLMQGEA